MKGRRQRKGECNSEDHENKKEKRTMLKREGKRKSWGNEWKSKLRGEGMDVGVDSGRQKKKGVLAVWRGRETKVMAGEAYMCWRRREGRMGAASAGRQARGAGTS